MRWVRSRRFGNYLALFALALQFTLSFAHVHLDGVHRFGPAVMLSGPTAHAAQSLVRSQPTNDADDGYCAICATIYLVANSFVPPAPLLQAPLVSRTIEHRDRVAVAVITPRRSPFQSRAPPLV